MKIHFIAIGGAIMHSLAISLKRKGHIVSGSDDKIADPAKTNLTNEGLMPETIGFFPHKITSETDAVILGMHARADNPELLRAQELGIPVYSFPQYVYEVAKQKTRIVIAGSHGKTSITAMVMHVLHCAGLDMDYIVGAKVKGFETGVRLSESAPIIVIEGDEYLASPIHRESKFLYYQPHIALISGVAWDHINVFPVYENYVQQFARFAQTVAENGTITYFQEDKELQKIFSAYAGNAKVIAYNTPSYRIENGVSILSTNFGDVPLHVFGEHNLQNIAGAKIVCMAAGVSEENFYRAISSFEGAANRLQLLGKTATQMVYKDFAHSPSKLLATVRAMKAQFPNRKLVAAMELHTFSSLNADFLAAYKHTMCDADVAIIFTDEEAMQLKKMPALEPALIKKSFARPDLHIFTERNSLENFLLTQRAPDTNFLLMTSGQFGGIEWGRITEQLTSSDS